MFKLLKRIEDMLALCERRVNIGINEHASQQTRHGVLWVEADVNENAKHNVRIPVIIDKPHLVRHGLNYATWRRLKSQVEKMGIKVTHLELKFDDAHYCYQMSQYKELYAGRKGTPVYTAASA